MLEHTLICLSLFLSSMILHFYMGQNFSSIESGQTLTCLIFLMIEMKLSISGSDDTILSVELTRRDRMSTCHMTPAVITCSSCYLLDFFPTKPQITVCNLMYSKHHFVNLKYMPKNLGRFFFFFNKVSETISIAYTLGNLCPYPGICCYSMMN